MPEDKGIFVPCCDNPFSHTGKRNDLAEGMSTGCILKWRGETVCMATQLTPSARKDELIRERKTENSAVITF